MKILLFSDFSLPNSCAAATRVMALAKLLQQCGHSVDLLGVSYNNTEPLNGVSDGIPYQMLRAKSWTGFQAYKRICFLRKDLANYLKEQTNSVPYDCIVLSNVYYDYAHLLMHYAAKHGTKLVVNAVEWYDKNNERFKGLTGKLNFIKNRIALMWVHKKMGNILAISSWLDKYYKTRGCRTITVPTILDMTEYVAVAHTDIPVRNKVHIAYAGMPGKKDLVLNAVRALPLLTDEERQRIQLHFYGVTAGQLCRLGISQEFVKTYRENLICHGKIPYGLVKEKIADADFTVLLRPNLRYANAGFPTKVGESMACGTPVIANLTSDLNRYVLDGKTGFACADETSESCAVAFRKALQLTPNERAAMRKNTLQMAKSAFDYRAYAKDISEFLRLLK